MVGNSAAHVQRRAQHLLQHLHSPNATNVIHCSIVGSGGSAWGWWIAPLPASHGPASPSPFSPWSSFCLLSPRIAFCDSSRCSNSPPLCSLSPCLFLVCRSYSMAAALFRCNLATGVAPCSHCRPFSFPFPSFLQTCFFLICGFYHCRFAAQQWFLLAE